MNVTWNIIYVRMVPDVTESILITSVIVSGKKLIKVKKVFF